MDDNTKPDPSEASWPASPAPIATALAPYPTTAGRLRPGNTSSDGRRSPRAAVKENARLPVRAAYAALAWVVVFFAFHIYWYLGGSFASPGKLPDLIHHSLVGWILEVLVDAAWPLGAWVCLAIARGWPQGRMRRAASIVVWLGCVVLVLRGGAGIVDDLTRATGLLPNGLTGLSTKQTTGIAHLTWSGWAIDAYFFAGGLLFGLLAYRYRPPRSEKRQRVTMDLPAHRYVRPGP
jgi:hypothetical protein